MKQVIILHGVAESHQHFLDEIITGSVPFSEGWWMPWIARELIKKNILTQRPQMPNAWMFGAKYSEWTKFFKNFNLDAETVVIGHSAGGGVHA